MDGAAGDQDYFVGTDPGDVITVEFDSLSSVAGYTAADLSIGSTSVDSLANASGALGDLDTAIDLISEARANVGAYVSRFDFRAEQIATAIENIDAAKSAIMDVDLAAEQSRLVSSQVLVQASVSALSQANQLPQSLLRLLQ